MNLTTLTVVVMAVSLASAAVASLGVYAAVKRIPVREVEVASINAVIAARNIPVGTLLVKEDLKVVAWPARNPIPNGFKSIDQVTNRGLISPVAENEPITEGKLAPVGAGSYPDKPGGDSYRHRDL